MTVYEKRCNECLFSDARIVDEERAAEVLSECARKSCHFVCHKASIAGEDVMCRGQYDAIERGDLPAPQLLRMAMRLRVVQFVPLPALTGKRKAGGA